ncbi:unnamed protein product [Mytilus edulis]|uniref:HAT C-terminal dimerisation domain-containing protein n=1 Tax=Mytilus edulis TaxID=6550 RepID=A0A8S3SRQ9_MYTED|nr:unnamed protein product [Mytilus edulis]
MTKYSNRLIDGALTWGSVFETFRDGLDNIKLVIDALLSLPPTSVNKETTFSRIKLSKGKRRGHLKTDTLKDLIQVEIETDNVEQFDPKLDDRRRRVGYSRPSRLTETLQTNTVDQETVVVGHDEIDTPAAGQDIQMIVINQEEDCSTDEDEDSGEKSEDENELAEQELFSKLKKIMKNYEE